MSYDNDKFVHEQSTEVFDALVQWRSGVTITGKRWSPEAIVLDWEPLFEEGETDLVLLLVEDDPEHPSLPFVITVVHPWTGARDIRYDMPERYASVRDATIAFDEIYR